MTARYQLIHQPTGRRVAIVTKALGWWAKGRGVLGRSSLPMGEGLWLPGVASVHTFGVRFSLDLLFLSTTFTCVCLLPRVPPGRWMVRGPGACHTLELGAGTLETRVPATRIGDNWLLERLPDAVC